MNQENATNSMILFRFLENLVINRGLLRTNIYKHRPLTILIFSRRMTPIAE